MKKILVVLMQVILLCACSKEQSSDVNFSLKSSGDLTKEDINFFKDFYVKMIKAVENEDVEMSFSFYSENFMKDSEKEVLKKNIERLYSDYKNAVYVVENVSLVVKKDEAITEDDYSYSAIPEKTSEDLKPIVLKGHERIYWRRENNLWKIYQWVYY